jgi:hypothetical protein
MTPLRLLLGLFVATASFTAIAHDTLGRDWCVDPNSVPEILGEFEFKPRQLKALSRVVVPAEAIDKCGMVDRSQWHSAMHISGNFCENLSGGDENVKAIILEPSSYAAAEHHSAYTFSEGLSGVCVYCPPKPTKPRF